MIAARPIHDLTRNLGRDALDLPMAALAGLAVAFLAFAMPADLLTRLVEASGLPAIFAAAEPPLGMKARAGLGFVGAIAAFALVFALLRLLGRKPAHKDKPAADVSAAALREELEEDERPRVRRRDFHPDAPAPRPISALRDFGEPAPPPLDYTPPPAPEPEPELVEAIAPEPVAPEVEAEAAEPTLEELMARLESGLKRRRGRRSYAAPAQSAPAPRAPAPQVFPEAGDDRLASAIESLQRFTAHRD